MVSMENEKLIGVDLGGTKVQSSRINGTSIEATHRTLISSRGPEDQVVQEVISNIDEIFEPEIKGIGVGVPGLVDSDGVLYDIQNIPSWKKVPLKTILEDHFKVPVHINNDANCFALGEKYYGKGIGRKDMMGLIMGTGLAAGIIIDDKLYNGHNCGAGEFGMLPYLDHNYEVYATGQFFPRVHKTTGEAVFKGAQTGDPKALEVFRELGTHIGNCMICILYSLDPEVIILGGSVSKSYKFYKDALYERLQTFAYSPVVGRLTIEISEDPNIAVLGAAALIHDAELRVKS